MRSEWIAAVKAFGFVLSQYAPIPPMPSDDGSDAEWHEWGRTLSAILDGLEQ